MAPAKTYEVRVVLVDGDRETVTLARVIAPDDDSVDAAALAAVDAAITDADMRPTCRRWPPWTMPCSAQRSLRPCASRAARRARCWSR